MALDLSTEALERRIDTLRSGYTARSASLLLRNRAFLGGYSPEFSVDIGELDQWPDVIKQSDNGKTRSSFNLIRAVVEIWTALEAEELPAVRWQARYLPQPAPSLNDQVQQRNVASFRAAKLVAGQVATMREQSLLEHVRRTKLLHHFYRAVTRKNIYGHSWLKSWPDMGRQTFAVASAIDPATVYPVWSRWDSEELEGILVATRRSAQLVRAQYPQADLRFDDDGLGIVDSSYYQPVTGTSSTPEDRRFVWVEDVWWLDREYVETVDTNEGSVTTRSLVVNAIRVNGKIVERTEYPGWYRVPFFMLENEDARDSFGFSDAGTMLPIQDAFNRFLSQQQDVIGGESNPKFVHRTDNQSDIEMSAGGVIRINSDEDLAQLAVHLDVFPTQVHGQQLLEILSRTTGLPDTVWGRIAASQNSGKALATSWRAVAARMVPRTMRNSRTLDQLYGFWLDVMELHDWDSARALYGGNRDFALDWPNKEPRDASEVSLDVINKVRAGLISIREGMEEIGVESPDEMDEEVRADFMDEVRYPEKQQSRLLLAQTEQAMALQAQQAGLAAQAAQAQIANMGAQPGGGAPGGGRPQAAAAQAAAQASAQSAPAGQPGVPAPATQAGQNGNPQTQVSTLVQDGGAAQNRIIQKRNV